MAASPLVSVIIPTTRRPDLIQRSVRSVMAQTVRDIEVIVVVEGPNPETMSVLSGIEEPRLRVVCNEAPLGAGGARNRGAALAHGEWVAFLDDDDEWMPDKLERQLAAAGEARDVLLTCCAHVRTPKGDYTWPRRLYDGRTPVDEYLFDRQSWFRGDTIVNTSSFMLPRALFARTQFGLTRQNEDNTLLLRVTKQAGGRILMVPEPLIVMYKEEDRESLGSTFDWRDMLAWADGWGSLFTRRAYAGFCLVYLTSQAARQADFAAMPLLLGRALRRGTPRAIHLALFFAFWAVPMNARQRVRSLIRGRGGRRAAA